MDTVVAIPKVVHIASPLQSLTIWDTEINNNNQMKRTRRELFLSKFRIGLQAEVEARQKHYYQEQVQEQEPQVQQVQQKKKQTKKTNTIDPNQPNWAKQAASMDREMFYSNEKIIERAHDNAIVQVEQELLSSSIAEATAATKASRRTKTKLKNNNNNNNNNYKKYQFVGVINPISVSPSTSTSISSLSTTNKPPITWYARIKPNHSVWTIRLVHVNRNVIIKDLFDNNRIDIYGTYQNTGTINPDTKQPIVSSHYTVRKKSWRNLWNFSPKHLVTDSSGMYWRERRLRDGLYTDGNTVYEASYRYRDGRNGMHKVTTLTQYLNSTLINTNSDSNTNQFMKRRQQILKRLTNDAPDVVLEE